MSGNDKTADASSVKPVRPQGPDDKLRLLLEEIYGPESASRWLPEFTGLLARNPVAPRHYEASQEDVMVIAYPDHINMADESPLCTLQRFSDTYLKDITNTMHILPHYPSTSDDGFAVSDYLAVDPAYGSWDDVASLSRSFSLMLDAVFNHTSASHPWFKDFLRGDPLFQNFYIELSPDSDVSAVTRPRTHPLLTAFDAVGGQKHIWTTFSHDQPDLNYDDPAVLLEIIDILLKYVGYGADLVRLDAIGYAWKRLGTNSIHLPEAHAIVRLMREVLDRAAPWVWLVTETNVPHIENISYFGNGHDEARMVYNFALPPLIIHTLQTGNAATLTSWATTLRTPSDDTHFLNFTASHDGVGVRGVNNILTPAEIKAMCEGTVRRGGLLSMRTDGADTETVYEMNISFFDAVADPDAPLTTRIDQFICSQAIALSLKGMPGIYLHSLLGSTNWPEGVKQSGRNRTINREKLRFNDVVAALEDPASQRHQVYQRYRQLLATRKSEALFSPVTGQKIHDYGEKVFAVERHDGNSRDKRTLLALHNVSDTNVLIPIEGAWTDLISGQTFEDAAELQPYQIAWLKRPADDRHKK